MMLAHRAMRCLMNEAARQINIAPPDSHSLTPFGWSNANWQQCQSFPPELLPHWTKALYKVLISELMHHELLGCDVSQCLLFGIIVRKQLVSQFFQEYCNTAFTGGLALRAFSRKNVPHS